MMKESATFNEIRKAILNQEPYIYQIIGTLGGVMYTYNKPRAEVYDTYTVIPLYK